jgi:Homeodomain-like domain
LVMVAPTMEGWAMRKKYVVRLTDAEREMLTELLKKQRVSAQKVRRARILLKADADGPNWTDARIADAFDCRTHCVECLRERLVTEGFEVAVQGKPKSRVRRKVLDGEQEAKIIALRLGSPPRGFGNWTLRLLAEQAVALEIVESVSYETLRRTLKKTR